MNLMNKEMSFKKEITHVEEMQDGILLDDYTLTDMLWFMRSYAKKEGLSMIDYIENDAEIAMPINELMHEDDRHLTKREYGKVLLKYLVKELRVKFKIAGDEL